MGLRQDTARISSEEIAHELETCDRVRRLLDSRTGPRLACVDTYGCQQNEADSERIRGFLSRMGYGFTQDAHEADLVLLNTCAIREHAEHRVLGNVGALVHTKRKNPRQIIAVCGCMAQEEHVAQKLKSSYPHVDLVFGPHMLWRFPSLLAKVLEDGGRIFSHEDTPGAIAEGIPVVRQSKLKAWVSIMYGCNNFCTYCIVPYVRGRERSRLPQDILAEIRQLAQEGYKDITLLGQNVNSYGKDLPEPVTFAWLLEQAASIPGDFLLRFMTSHPKDASEELFDVMARCEKVAPHFHLPVQAGSSRVLAAMNRRYTREKYLEQVAALRTRVPQVVLTSDIIVGFPGETQEEFEETMTLLETVEYDALFTFLFSPREGTPAAKLPDPMPMERKKENFQRLVDLQNEISARKHQAYVGQTLRCLIDGREEGSGLLTGRTPGGRLVRLEGEESLVGQFIPVTIQKASTWALMGEQSPS